MAEGTPEGWPANLLVETTTTCNMRCPGCYMDGALSQRLVFSWDLFRDIVATTKPRRVSLLGGEPLLWEPLREAVRYCRERQITVIVATNLVLMTGDLAAFLFEQDVKVIGKWNVGQPHDDKQRRVQAELIGSTEHMVQRMVQGLQHLKSAGFSGAALGLENFVRCQNVPYVADFLRFCQENAARPFLELSSCDNDLSPSDIGEIVRQVRKYHTGELMAPHFLSVCHHADSSIYIRPNGDMQACSGNPTVLANFLTDTDALSRAWHHPIIETRRRIAQIIEGPCRECEVLEQCRGGCRAYAERLAPTASYAKCWRLVGGKGNTTPMR